MIAHTDSPFSLPGVRLGPVNTSTKFIDRYRALSNRLSSVLAAFASFGLATVCGFLGGVAAMYLYDRANSKGDDVTVGLGGLFAVGTFMFVTVFTWLQKAHHPVSSRTPQFAFYACLVPPVVSTLFFAGDLGDYVPLVLGSWLAILILGLLSLLLCRRWCQHEEPGF